MSDELRDILDKAISDAEGEEGSGAAAPDGGAPAGDGGGPDADSSGEEGTGAVAASKSVPADRSKDPEEGAASGEVKPGEDPNAQIPTNAPAAKPSTPAPNAPAASALRPPVSMKPEARALWDKVPAEVQAEFHRRDREVNEALRSSADARRFHEEFRQTVAPYEAMIRAEGSEPIKAVENLFKTAAALRTASAPVKAKMVADIVRDFNIDVVMLDSALSGTLPPPGPKPAYLQEIEQQLAPIQQFVQQFQGQAQAARQRTEAEAAAEIEEFFANEEQYPYANDLRDDIADILEVAARRGVKLSLQDAYSRATMLHPTISKLVENRGVAQQVAQQNAAAQRARNAAASVRSAPTGSGGDEGEDDDSIRGALNKSIAKVSGRV